MSSFADRFGGLTVEQALELNKAAEEFCSMEATSECDTIQWGSSLMAHSMLNVLMFHLSPENCQNGSFLV